MTPEEVGRELGEGWLWQPGWRGAPGSWQWFPEGIDGYGVIVDAADEGEDDYEVGLHDLHGNIATLDCPSPEHAVAVAHLLVLAEQTAAGGPIPRLCSDDCAQGRDEERAAVVEENLSLFGVRIALAVDRLWPEEDDPAYRAGCLAEEAGEVVRAVTKRRHALRSVDRRCKGLSPEEWTEELAVELGQVLGVVLDIAHREGIDMWERLRACVATLEASESGS